MRTGTSESQLTGCCDHPTSRPWLPEPPRLPAPLAPPWPPGQSAVVTTPASGGLGCGKAECSPKSATGQRSPRAEATPILGPTLERLSQWPPEASLLAGRSSRTCSDQHLRAAGPVPAVTSGLPRLSDLGLYVPHWSPGSPMPEPDPKSAGGPCGVGPEVRASAPHNADQLRTSERAVRCQWTEGRWFCSGLFQERYHQGDDRSPSEPKTGVLTRSGSDPKDSGVVITEG